MKTCCIKNPDITCFLFGDDIGIMDLREYYKAQDKNDNLTMIGILNRILMHQIYGYVKPVTFRGLFLAVEFNLHLLKNGRKVKETDWDEAYVISFPDAAKKRLDLTDEVIEAVVKNSKWTKIGI